MINANVPKIYSQIEAGMSPLKAIREALGLNQQELATKLGVAVSTVSRWETGRTPPLLTLSQVKAFGQLLHELGLGFDSFPDYFGPKKTNSPD